MFHTVWGLKSLSREAKEQYNVEEGIEKWITNPWGDSLELQTIYNETDETYLPHLQKYFKLDEVPFETKSIHIFQKNK